MPVHRILIQWNEHFQLVAHAPHRPVAGANCQEGMSAANDRLVSVIRINVEPASGEDPGQDVTRAGDALPIFTANSNRKIRYCHCCFLFANKKFFSAGAGEKRRPKLRRGRRRAQDFYLVFETFTAGIRLATGTR